jgi:hypothetical protein
MRLNALFLLAAACVGCSSSSTPTQVGSGGRGASSAGATNGGGPGAGGATTGGGAGTLGVSGGGGGNTHAAGAAGQGTGGSAGGASGGSAGMSTGAAGEETSGAAGESSAGSAGTTLGGAGGAGTAGRWKPAADTTFYWDLQNTPPDNTKDVGAYDIDGWGNDASEVTALHARGIKVVCYMDAGTYEPGRPDSADFPASLKGNAVQGWPGELWLDVRPSGPNYAKLQAIMRARFEVCQSKGFDAVEPDNLDSYQNHPGFSTTAADELAYNEWLASTAHGLGLAIFQKNDLDQIGELEPFFDGILDEECNQYSECDTLQPYVAAGKPAWDAEYTEDGATTASFCAADVNAEITGALFALALDGSLFEPCSNDQGIHN